MVVLRSCALAGVAIFLAWSCASPSGSGGSASGVGGSATASSGSAAGGSGGGCQPGYADCDGAADNGCEAFVVSDAKRCGACDKICPTAKHAAAKCADSQCQLDCNAGYTDCNMSLDDGCEAALNSDAKHCGAWGQTCPTSCDNGFCKPVVLADAQAHPYALAIDATYVYWVNEGVNFSDDGAVMRVAKTGGVPQELAGSQSLPTSVAVDASNVYWTNFGTGTVAAADGAVYSMPKGGGAITTIADKQVATGSVVVDATHAYFLNAGTSTKNYEDGEIRMVPLAGGTVKVLATAQLAPNRVAVQGKFVYWVSLGHEANNYLDGSLWRVSLNDVTPTPVKLADKLGFPAGLDLDPTQIYFPQALYGSVFRMKLDGGMATVVTNTGKLAPFAVALDGPNLYLAAADQNNAGSIHRVAKAGGKSFQLMAMSGIPHGLAVDATRIYWADTGTPEGPNGAVFAVSK